MQINIDASNPDLYNDIYLPYLEDYSKELLIFYGGSSSGKSKFVAQRNILNIMKGKRNYLICRKVGDTIRNTVFVEYKKAILDFGLNELFVFNETEMTIRCKNGYKMLFKGLDNPEKVKSLIFEKGVLTDIHIEEATDISESDYEQLNLRLRGGSLDVSKQTILTFNPISQLHWIKKRFFDKYDDNINILKTTYKDNKFLTEQDKRRIERYETIDIYYYNVYALGNWGALGNLIFYNWEVQDLTEQKNMFNKYYYGLDFGYANDPLAYIKVAVRGDTVYILDEHYQTGLTNDRIAEMLRSKGMNSYIMCDSAEPKSIAELRNFGIQAVGVKKGKDSVNYGIQWLKQKKMIIDVNCINIINELQLYKWREIKDKGVIPEPVDMFNHGIDSLRYSLEELMGLHEIQIPKFNLSSLGL